MVTELLSMNLSELHKLCNNRFSLKTTLMLFHQLLESFEHIHAKKYMHLDIKPTNLMMGLGRNSNRLFCIDFNISRSYSDKKTRKHIAYSTDEPFAGNYCFASPNIHRGLTHSRRDDLISIAYVVLYFYKGELPWNGYRKREDSPRQSNLGMEKCRVSNRQLFEGCPAQFEKYMDYVRSLRFNEGADFTFLKQLVRSAAEDARVDIFDGIYDWTQIVESIKDEPGVNLFNSFNDVKKVTEWFK